MSVSVQFSSSDSRESIMKSFLTQHLARHKLYVFLAGPGPSRGPGTKHACNGWKKFTLIPESRLRLHGFLTAVPRRPFSLFLARSITDDHRNLATLMITVYSPNLMMYPKPSPKVFAQRILSFLRPAPSGAALSFHFSDFEFFAGRGRRGEGRESRRV